MASRDVGSASFIKPRSVRSLPPLSAWTALAQEFRSLMHATYDDFQTSEAFTLLELRAGKLLATFLEQGRRPAGWTGDQTDGLMRRAVEREENAMGWPPGWTPGRVGTGLSIAFGITEPKRVPMFGATFTVQLAWMVTAFSVLPSQYPDCFAVREPSMEHPLTRFTTMLEGEERNLLRAHKYVERAQVQAAACGLLAAQETWETKQKPGQQRRRRGTPITDRRPTDRQLEAIQQYGMCNGNFTKMAEQMGVDRSTAKQHYKAGQRKVGADVAKKLNPKRSGRVDRAESSDRGPLPSKAGRSDPLKHHTRNGG